MSGPAFYATHVKHCKCGQPARPNQRNCYACNAAAGRRWREREAERRKMAGSDKIAAIVARMKAAEALRALAREIEKGSGA